MEAFRKYDFGNDEGWKAYLSRVEIPNDSEALLTKLKAKYYKREIDPDFDVASIASAGTGSAAPPPGPSGQPAAAKSQPPRPSPASQSLLASRSALYCLAGEYVLVLAAIVSLQPFVPRLSFTAYTMACQMALLTNAIKVFSLQGLPRFTPFPSALLPWLTGVTSSPDFFPLLFSVILASNRHLSMGVVPLALHALLHADSESYRLYGSAGWYQGTLGRVHKLVAPNTEQLKVMAAGGEITVAFLSVLSIVQLGIRGAGTAFVLWNQMRMRYQAPQSSRYHRQVWTILYQKVQPLLQRVPVLQQVCDKGAAWFNRRA